MELKLVVDAVLTDGRVMLSSADAVFKKVKVGLDKKPLTDEQIKEIQKAQGERSIFSFPEKNIRIRESVTLSLIPKEDEKFPWKEGDIVTLTIK